MAARARDALQSTASPTFPPIPPLQSRRVSFRKSISEASLPPSYLEQLEQKRKQLDESIHKYIASKEREYKNFERDLGQRVRHGVLEGSAKCGEAAVEDGGKRRTSSESTTMSMSEVDGVGSPVPNPQRGSAVASNRPRDSDGVIDEGREEGTAAERKAALAGLRDRTASMERDKDLVGVFTPPFLPALESDKEDVESRGLLVRSVSAPATSSSTIPNNEPGDAGGGGDPKRARSDPSIQTTAQAKAKRPSQLVLASRTSSSGSSADGRLTSAMKSPTQRERPKRKRVSLAVGDSIVAPSDSVPMSLSSNNHAPSHSRSRSPVVHDGDDTVNVPAGDSVLVNDSGPANMSFAGRVEQVMSPQTTRETAEIDDKPSKPVPSAPAMATRSSNAISSHTPAATIDPDGDFFDLEEDDDGGLVRHGADDLVDEDESAGESDQSGVVGRIHPTHSPALVPDERHDDDTEAGLVSEPDSLDEEAQSARLDFQPGSVVASQQPTNPGFRRPSVSRDPIFAGADYETAAGKAADDEIYGSSYSRPATKGSFTSGSLGESFMERNAAELRMRAAMARREAEVES